MIFRADAAAELKEAEEEQARAEHGLARAIASQVRGDLAHERGHDAFDVARLLDETRLALPSWGGATRTMLEARLRHAADDLREGADLTMIADGLEQWATELLTGVPF